MRTRAKPVDVTGVRRMMGEAADGLTDDDIRRALVRLGAAVDEAGSADDVAEQIRRFAAAVDRLAE